MVALISRPLSSSHLFQKETSEYLYITRRGTKDEPTVYRFFVILEKEGFFFLLFLTNFIARKKKKAGRAIPEPPNREYMQAKKQ